MSEWTYRKGYAPVANKPGGWFVYTVAHDGVDVFVYHVAHRQGERVLSEPTRLEHMLASLLRSIAKWRKVGEMLHIAVPASVADLRLCP